jgi:hypothetical protein
VERLFKSFVSKSETKIDISQIFNFLPLNISQIGITEQCQMQVITFLNVTANINLGNPASLWPILG